MGTIETHTDPGTPDTQPRPTAKHRPLHVLPSYSSSPIRGYARAKPNEDGMS